MDLLFKFLQYLVLLDFKFPCNWDTFMKGIWMNPVQQDGEVMDSN